MEKKEHQKSEISKREEEILSFWAENKIFERSLAKDSMQGEFVFYDGPPFATGLPHYGHILPGTIKDVIPRYQTMKGKKVRRQWGWDCHGLPLENIIEKELGLATKKDIEEFGIDRFNEEAKKVVLRYADDWKKIIPRTGRWVDMENDYRTMDTSYSETVWWIFKQLYDKGLIYEGFKSMHLCPRCETTLSNFEVNQGYKDIKDLSVVAAFRLKDKEASILAWTTTPWTLPGNMALAVDPLTVYAKVKTARGIYILAESRLGMIKEEFEIVETISGSELVGRRYEPLFDQYVGSDHENIDNAWMIYGADFISTEEGTGIVHIAPAFGDDDLSLAIKHSIPIIHHVDRTGRFKEEVAEFKGLPVKPKDDHQSADILVIKYLAAKGSLFAKEKIEHSYPHCWRCETPLLNYASSSWFVKVTDIKEEIISENRKVNWIPSDLRDGRFGKWLEGARDWAISRSRFWGAPLPVWKCEDCPKVEVLGSIEDIRKRTRSKNKYIVMRHGEAESNTLDIISSIQDHPHHLTEKGKAEIVTSAKILKDENINLIISSPYVRTHETAEIAREILGLGQKDLIIDDRISELNAGKLNGRKWSEYTRFFKTEEERYEKPVPGGENLFDLKKRMTEFIYDIDKKYSGKNILIVTHGAPAKFLFAVAKGSTNSEIEKERILSPFFDNGEVRELDFAPLPINKNYELDLHMPYIDDIHLTCECGGVMRRVKEVFDCWFESGSMPYAQHHHPFSKKPDFDPENSVGFPADFIAEGMDQTRGWFYSLLVLSTAIFKRSAYKNVIVHGLVLAEDGRKMSKRLKNYPDPMYIIDSYGADALRYYLLSSPVIRGEELNFSEKGVDEVVKKLLLRLENVYAFYALYSDADSSNIAPEESKNVLDRWIMSRLYELQNEVTLAMDRYELDRATRPFMQFVEDLSTWYIRRSRDRFKGLSGESERNAAVATTRKVLLELSKTMAPFMPFKSEDIYGKLKGASDSDSVHLEDWPTGGEVDEELLKDMKKVRDVITLGLEARARAGIKVRQPLSLLEYGPAMETKKELHYLVLEELNVKQLKKNKDLSEDVLLDTAISAELKEEGNVRELIRRLQDMRKKMNLKPDEPAVLHVDTDEEGKRLIKTNIETLRSSALIDSIHFENTLKGEGFDLEGVDFIFEIKKKSGSV
jgi:isoleucyl-tRNA synthetase